jgi:hypothetical protein
VGRVDVTAKALLGNREKRDEAIEIAVTAYPDLGRQVPPREGSAHTRWFLLAGVSRSFTVVP